MNSSTNNQDFLILSILLQRKVTVSHNGQIQRLHLSKNSMEFVAIGQEKLQNGRTIPHYSFCLSALPHDQEKVP